MYGAKAAMATKPAEQRVLVPPGQSTAVRYGVALVLGAIALIVGCTVPTSSVLKVSFTTSFTLLIALAAWLGGAGPGLVCTALCALGVTIWLEPAQSLEIEAPE